ncbi:MAG TPA: CTP synthase [Candidatus Saccharimonadales bacterium]|nr:CTP synthase [Candidatus Saccharimonadales bacterium]
MAKSQTKYIFVTGGVLSGLGKGITAASLGTILKARGFSVNIMKCDPYLNTDAGTLNPAEHGEVFVTADGAETDLDLGHYERFLDAKLTKGSSVMNGQIYTQLVADERAGKYLGKTVQVIPHVTDTIQESMLAAGKGYDIHIIEIGGTIGDYESVANIDAIRQFRRRVGRENVVSTMVVYLPFLEASKELKTKPAQNAVRDLRAAGVNLDIIFARADHPVDERIINKMSLFCDLDKEAIVPLPTARSVYEVPLTLESSGIADYICAKLGLAVTKPDLKAWQELNLTITNRTKPAVRIGVVAKYMDHEDTYMSVIEAIKSAAWAHGRQPKIVWVDAERVEKDGPEKLLKGLDGIVVPGGFGSRGVEGKIAAAAYARQQQLPYLGLCLGLQVAVIAVAREALNDPTANTTEIDSGAKHPVIALMDEQRRVVDKGGTMRLGNYPCKLTPGSKAAQAYGSEQIEERHRHRYEFNNEYRKQLEVAGLNIVGTSPDNKLVEVVELADHPFFVASQFHPEFTSRPQQPNPLFDAFLAAVVA